jgi:hypothetical protein
MMDLQVLNSEILDSPVLLSLASHIDIPQASQTVRLFGDAAGRTKRLERHAETGVTGGALPQCAEAF